jgi:hypothetical protein
LAQRTNARELVDRTDAAIAVFMWYVRVFSRKVTRPGVDLTCTRWAIPLADRSMRFSFLARADGAAVPARVEAVLRAIMRVRMLGDRLPTMREVAHAEFQSALRDRGTDPAGFDLAVRIDEATGATAFVLESGGKKRTWSLSEFQAWLSQS